MTRAALMSLSGLALVALLAPACSPAPGCDHPMDDRLTLAQVQVKGTHNSYHLAPEHGAVPDLDYTHAPLDVQLDEQGVRQFELDIYFQPDRAEFRVAHILDMDLDPDSSCSPLVECLGLLRAWSDEHPAHLPLAVFVDLKDYFDAATAEDYFGLLEARILSVWPVERLITPAQVQGDHPDLRSAVTGQGWPTLGEARGKALFVLFEGGDWNEHYTHGHAHLDGRLLFARTSNPALPFASVLMMDDPMDGFEAIQQEVAQGFLVRTRADSGWDEIHGANPDRRDKAFASGAHFVSTDAPAPVEGIESWVEVPDGLPARCNPVTAPEGCHSRAVEDPDCVRSGWPGGEASPER